MIFSLIDPTIDRMIEAKTIHHLPEYKPAEDYKKTADSPLGKIDIIYSVPKFKGLSTSPKFENSI